MNLSKGYVNIYILIRYKPIITLSGCNSITSTFTSQGPNLPPEHGINKDWAFEMCSSSLESDPKRKMVNNELLNEAF